MVDEKPEAVEQVQEKDCSAAGSEETSGNAKSLGVFSFEGDMSLAQAIPLGLQHVLAMFVGNLTPLLIVTGACGLAGAEFADVQLSLLQNAMWIAGVVTLVQLFGIGPVGGRVPIIMGTSSGFIGVFNSVAASMGGGLLAYGAIMGASHHRRPVRGRAGLFPQAAAPVLPGGGHGHGGALHRLEPDQRRRERLRRRRQRQGLRLV